MISSAIIMIFVIEFLLPFIQGTRATARAVGLRQDCEVVHSHCVLDTLFDISFYVLKYRRGKLPAVSGDAPILPQMNGRYHIIHLP